MSEAAAARTPVHPCAIDSVLLIRQSARRMLCAVQEYRGSTVIIPAEAARESPKVYQNAAAKQARRESRAAARVMQGEWSERERKAWVLEDALRRKEVKIEAFARWIEWMGCRPSLERKEPMATQRCPVTPRTTFGWMEERAAEEVMGGIGK